TLNLFVCLCFCFTPTILNAQNCLPPYPIPTGTTSRPMELFDLAEYFPADGSVPLQGNRQKIKYAPVMYSATGGGLGNFQTVLIVNNPDNFGTLVVDYTIYESTNGGFVDSQTLTIPANGKEQVNLFALDGSGPYGLVCVSVAADSEVPDFVGCTVYTANEIANPFESALATVTADDAMVSVQPLQELQRFQAPLNLGPFPASLDAHLDVINGIFGLVNVINPTRGTLDLTLITSSEAGVQDVTNITLGPNEGTQYFGAWLRARAVYRSGLPAENITVTIRESNNLPFIAEGLIFDLISESDIAGAGGSGSPLTGMPMPWTGVLVGDRDPQPLGHPKDAVGGRARMTSFMPGYSSNESLFCPELTQVSSVGMGTHIAMVNVATEAATNVIAEYFDMDGALLGSDNIGSVPRGGSIQIGLGCPDSPNFPDNVFRGFARIHRCSGKLIGYSNRANEDDFSAKKMYGESLIGTGRNEHSRGWREGGFRNIIAPLVFQNDPKNPVTLSNYVAFANTIPGNTGTYQIEAYEDFGTPDGLITFAGLRAFNTSGTYFDSFVSGFNFFADSAVIRTQNSFVRGINVIGDGGRRLTPEVPVYPGPGDTVPF
ncbi:MAG: hypothetical protein AAGA30_08455, partial [Planctomycetota bacterium]